MSSSVCRQARQVFGGKQLILDSFDDVVASNAALPSD